MLGVVVAAALGYGTAGDTSSPLGPWLVGGYPQEMSLNTAHLKLHEYLDAFDHDFVVCDDELPWSSDGTDGCVHMQLVATAVDPHFAHAPSVAFLRHSRFRENAGHASFKSFGYTATSNEVDNQFYYPLAATTDNRQVLLIRAPNAVPPTCNTRACLYDHMDRLSSMMDFVANRTLDNETHPADAGPVTTTKYYFVSGADHLPASSTGAAISMLAAAVGLAVAVVIADALMHQGRFEGKEPPINAIPISTELVAVATLSVVATAVTTLFVVYWDIAASKEHTSIRSIDADNKAHKHLPAWSYVYVGLSAASVVVAIGYTVMRKNTRYSAYRRRVMLVLAAIAVALACALPTAYESALSARAMDTTNATLVDSALDAATHILLASYESLADARDALDDDSYMSTARTATLVGISLMVVFAALAAFINHARREHSPDATSASLVLASATILAATAAIIQLALSDHYHIEDKAICTLPPEGWAYMTSLGLAAAFYLAAAGLLIAGLVAKNRLDLSDTYLAPVPFLMIAAAGVGHTVGAYSHLDSHCPRLIDHHWIGTFSAVTIAGVIVALVLYAFATPPQSQSSEKDQLLETKNPVFDNPTKPENPYATIPESGPAKPGSVTVDGFFGL
jgi:hypothetical protein